MAIYAQLNDDGVCIGVSVLGGQVQDDNLVEIPEFDADYYLRRVYKNGKWQDTKMDYDNEKELLAARVAQLQAELNASMQAIAELTMLVFMMGGGAE